MNNSIDFSTLTKRPLLLAILATFAITGCATPRPAPQVNLQPAQPVIESYVGPAGPDGPTGPVGARGATGATGSAGVAVVGPAGPAGPVGATGAQGERGATGATGAMVVGPAGSRGAAGPAGAQGMTGLTGEQGYGLPGPAGPRGAAGATGMQGVVGSTGAQGPTTAGPAGPAGRTGAVGEQGAPGYTGGQGRTELAGVVGPAGSTGATGAQGGVGQAGLQGATYGNSGVVATPAMSGQRAATALGGAADGAPAWSAYQGYDFAADSNEIVYIDSNKAREIAYYMARNPSVQLGLDGASGYRVEVVRNALIGAGVPAVRIHDGAFGDSENRRHGHVAVLLSNY